MVDIWELLRPTAVVVDIMAGTTEMVGEVEEVCAVLYDIHTCLRSDMVFLLMRRLLTRIVLGDGNGGGGGGC